MKKKCSALLALVLVCCLLPLGALAATQIVRITHSRTVNVRSGPSTSYKMLGEVRPGQTFPYLGSKNGWNCIQYTSTQTGYVSGKLTSVETIDAKPTAKPTAKPAATEAPDTAMVRVTHIRKVNVRSGPGTNYGLMREINPGASYPYLGTADGWHCILLPDGRTGYVANNLTKVVGEEWQMPTWREEPAPSSSGKSSSSSSSKSSSGSSNSSSSSSESDCSYCGGDGKDTCTSCNGRGKYDCGGCYNGTTSCGSCGGSGTTSGGRDCFTCGGDGRKRCSSCNGSSERTCSGCNGNKTKSCNFCGGDGKR